MPPQDVAGAQHEEETDADAADHVEEDHPDGRANPDRAVGRAHALVSARERLGDLHEARDFRQPVAGQHQPEAIPALAEDWRRSLVGQRVIDASARPSLLSLLRETERREVHVPARLCVGFGTSARVGSLERGPGRVLVELFDESVGPAVGGETNESFVGFSLSEVPYSPGVSAVQPLAEHVGEGGLASALELDEGLRLAVERERGRLPIVRRAQTVARGHRGRIGQRALARHRDVERHDRERPREVVIRRRGGGERDQGKQNPESWALHGVLLGAVLCPGADREPRFYMGLL